MSNVKRFQQLARDSRTIRGMPKGDTQIDFLRAVFAGDSTELVSKVETLYGDRDRRLNTWPEGPVGKKKQPKRPRGRR